jgi:2-oxoisovalerate dehydrogenase E1 component
MIENKALYAERVSDRTIDGFWCEDTGGPFPTTRIRSSANAEVTIVCYGGMLPEAEKALDRLFEEHEIVAEIVCPTQIYPLALEPILESVETTGRLVVVEEGQSFCGFGSEVIAGVHERSADLPPVMRRLGPAVHPLPSSKPAELASLPGADDLVKACVRLVRHA